jgi:hypothetical protein
MVRARRTRLRRAGRRGRFDWVAPSHDREPLLQVTQAPEKIRVLYGVRGNLAGPARGRRPLTSTRARGTPSGRGREEEPTGSGASCPLTLLLTPKKRCGRMTVRASRGRPNKSCVRAGGQEVASRPRGAARGRQGMIGRGQRAEGRGTGAAATWRGRMRDNKDGVGTGGERVCWTSPSGGPGPRPQSGQVQQRSTLLHSRETQLSSAMNRRNNSSRP